MSPSNPPPARLAEQMHKDELIWQILIPVLVCILAAIGIGILTVFTSINNPGINEKWAQISLVFLIFPLLFLGLILLVVIIITTRLITKTQKVLPPQFNKLDHLVKSVRNFTETSVNKVTTPIIAIKSTKSGVVRLFELAFHQRSNPKDIK